MSDIRVQRRRAVEALRAGVPNRDAVRELGSLQTSVEYRFDELLEGLRRLREDRPRPRGVIISGGFGSGKSHVLQYLQDRALRAGFMVSKVVVSKETPMHDPSKLCRAAIEAARLPDRTGTAIAEVALQLNPHSDAYAEFVKWSNDPTSELNGRFSATLSLHEYLHSADLEFVEHIVRFWAGDPIRLPDLQRKLKEIGQAQAYTFARANARSLAEQRFRFVARLATTVGYGGWVLLIDEVELVGRYSILQRAKAYAEVARLIEGPREDRAVPMAAVLACTDDFAAEILQPVGKDDLNNVPRRLQAKQTTQDDAMSVRAAAGMQLLDRETMALQPPDSVELDRTYARLKQVHAEAYGWSPPDVEGIERLGTNRMRQYVRAWINEWDLRRLDPAYEPHTEVSELAVDYAEDPDLEASSPDTASSED